MRQVLAADSELLCVGGAPCLDERVEHACRPRGPPGREGVSPPKMGSLQTFGSMQMGISGQIFRFAGGKNARFFYFQSESYILNYGFLHGATFLDMSAALSTS